MSFTVEAEGAAALKGKLDQLKDSIVTDGLLARLADEAREIVLKRTGAGKDIDGDAFAPYADGYRRLRAENGKPADTVDLRFSGRMLDDFITRVDGNTVELSFKTTESIDKAYRLQVGGTGAWAVRRRFLGLSPDETSLLTEICYMEIEKVIKEKA